MPRDIYKSLCNIMGWIGGEIIKKMNTGSSFIDFHY